MNPHTRKPKPAFPKAGFFFVSFQFVFLLECLKIMILKKKHMSDNASSKTPKKPTTEKSGKKPIKVNKTQQSLIGVFVFAFGVAIFIAVLYLGYAKFFKDGSASPEMTQAQNEEVEKRGMSDADDKGLSNVSYQDIVGNWFVQYDLRSAYVSLKADKTFELTVFMDPDAYERRLSIGKVEFDEEKSILRLIPNYDPLPRSEMGVTRTLTRRPYNIVALRDKNGQMYWVPHIIEGAYDQLHPMFINLYKRDSFIVWQKAKSKPRAQ